MSNIEFLPHGVVVTIPFYVANVAQNATTKCLVNALATQTTGGYIVPAGCKFVPIALSVQGNAACDTASATWKVTDDGTAVANGPEATIDTTNTTKIGATGRPGAVSIAAGHIVGVSVVAAATFNPTGTTDYDVHLVGVLLPA